MLRNAHQHAQKYLLQQSFSHLRVTTCNKSKYTQNITETNNKNNKTNKTLNVLQRPASLNLLWAFTADRLTEEKNELQYSIWSTFSTKKVSSNSKHVKVKVLSLFTSSDFVPHKYPMMPFCLHLVNYCYLLSLEVSLMISHQNPSLQGPPCALNKFWSLQISMHYCVKVHSLFLYIINCPVMY